MTVEKRAPHCAVSSIRKKLCLLLFFSKFPNQVTQSKSFKSEYYVRCVYLPGAAINPLLTPRKS